MAGKLHINYDGYATSDRTKIAIAPFTKLARAYAEGYRGLTVQLGGDPATAAAYASGQLDKTNGKPPSHCSP